MKEKLRNRTDKRTCKRIYFALFIFVFLLAVILGVLVKYQLIDYDYYQSEVLGQLTTETLVSPKRGDITDRNGVVLATTKTVYNIIVSPKHMIDRNEKIEKLNSDDDPDNDFRYNWVSEDGKASYSGTRVEELITEFFANLFDYDAEKKASLRAKLDLSDDKVKKRQYQVVESEVEEALDQRVRDFIAEFELGEQIYDRMSGKRYYPYGSLASHVVGFMSSSGYGSGGIEGYYNDYLEGTSGKYVLAQGAGKNELPFEYETYIPEQNGYTVVSTIDNYIQSALENQLEMTYEDSLANNRVMGIVLDIDTGGVLAMATYPSFDLNDPLFKAEGAKELLNSQRIGDFTDGNKQSYEPSDSEKLYRIWNNKAISETYEPGSTFKIITTAMALEEQVITFDTPFNCPGYWIVEGWPYPIYCHDHSGHGTLPYRYGLQQSCNPALMQVAALVGRERFYNYFEAFGYTSVTGIDLSGESYSVYNTADSFTNVSLAVYSFGQTFRTTAIQQLSAIATVASGGYYKTPHVLKEIVDEDGSVIKSYETDIKRQVVSTEVCEQIAAVLEDGVSGNGGAKNAYVKGYKVAAKTGTSEKRDATGEDADTKRVGSCIAFAPADDPAVAVIIVVDEPMNGSVYGSVVAAPYVSNLLSDILPYLGFERTYTDEDLATLSTDVANYVGGTPEQAKTMIEEAGLTCEIIGDGGVVTSQIPEAGSYMRAENGRVLLYCGAESQKRTTVVPDLMSKTAEAANMLLLGSELNVRITGAANGSSATVIEQTPAAGSTVEVGTVVEIELRHMDGTD